VPVGFTGVADYVNTTSGVATRVNANGGLGGTGVVVLGGAAPPPTIFFITTELDEPIDAENNDNLIV